ncbi:MAG: PIN domain nuclease [Verrucomicrobia bacterium]|nr:MAG: PIN domain nuclease [Verrucomicrobiota bacterium]
MPAYPDTSFLARIYLPHANSAKASAWMQRSTEPLAFTPLHRHELRNAVRLSVFRGEITAEQRKSALREIDADLAEGILAHTLIPWTDAFREAENLAATHTETLGVRSFDLLHVGLALALGATEFLTFDERQAALAKAAGLRVKP